MALSQDRYISIKSTNAGTPAVTDRELGGLIFTLGKGWKGAVPWDYGTVVEIHSATQAKKYFSSESDELTIAERYFNYASPSGTSPTSLTYVRMAVYNGTTLEEASPSVKVEAKPYGSSGISATLTTGKSASDVWSKFSKKTGAYTFEYDESESSWYYNGSAVTIGDYCITVSGTPTGGDKVVVTVSDMLSWKLKDNTYQWVDLSDTAVSDPTLESPKEALERVDKDTNNFGSFAYIDIDQWSCKQFREIAIFNFGKNYKYLFSISCLNDATADAADNVKMDKVKVASFMTYLGNGDIPEEYQSDDDLITGTSVINGCDKFSATMPMALFSATNYNGVNSATNYMFKQFAGETATVTDDDVADLLDEANINYYGLVQVNGQRKAFYQPGVNSNGENTAVYCNEIWLKSKISTAIMNLMLSTEMIPANEDGELMLYNTIYSIANKGITNGMIEIGKDLTDEQKATIYQLSGNSEAWFNVQQAGFYLTVTIEQTSTGKYKAIYQLIYSKGDAIVKVEGTDVLI